ncbi:oligoendopeptidase F [Mycoplasma haemofelis Ohio2]|uniref:Oligopeptidase F n=1 Tax=Mycoplasma haemofelis (strain Ohio2) TaxID=859194 RepID=F6FJC9_MYCHI|nr:oligoendopeptidase F [Mycoplasma haemofelis Ohio2]
MADSLKWDLEKILEGSTLEELKEEYFRQNQEISDLYDLDIFEDKEKLIKFHELSLRNTVTSNRLFNYLSNKHNEDLSNNEWFSLMQEIQMRSIPFMQKLSDFSDRVIKNKERILEFLQDPELSEHKKSYEDIFRCEKHELPPVVKKLLATYSPLASSFNSIFTLLMDKEIQVKPAKDSNRKSHIISNYSEFIKTQTDPDRVLRRNAYVNWYNAVNHSRESLARLLYYNFLELNIDAQNRNFSEGYYEASVFSDELPISFVPKIYSQVERFKKHWRRYSKIQKQLLKKEYSLKGLKPWDMRMPILKKDDDSVSIEEAKTLAQESLKILGEEYSKNLSLALSGGWIDWEVRKNKLSGAYCIGGCYGLENKYILLNYNYKIDDVYTLVHELGHAMHAVEFCKHQTHYASSSIFLAEIPSTLNELLLSFYLLDKYKKNPRKKLEIYDNLISNFFGTTISQIIFSEWEYDVNSIILKGGVLDAELGEKIFIEKQEKFYGKKKKISPLKKKSLTSIFTVPHFYSGEFYVYKYAIGQVVSLLIADSIQKDSQYINKYFNFLRVGSSLSNLEAIRLLEIDLESDRGWKRVGEIVAGWIEEYSSLANSI